MLWLQEIFILPQVSKERGSLKPNILNSIVKVNWTSEGVRWVGGGGFRTKKPSNCGVVGVWIRYGTILYNLLSFLFNRFH